jgi:Flp pilus assembly protein TadG
MKLILRGSRGSAAIEFALVASLLAAILASFGDLSNLVYTSMVTNNAAREGARAASAGDSGWSARVTSYVSGAGIPLAELASGYPCITSGTSAGPPCSASFPPSTTGNPLTVSVRLTVPITFPIMRSVLGTTVSVTGKSTMEVP